MRYLLYLFLFFNFVKSKNNIFDLFDSYGLDRTSTKIIKDFTSAKGFEFILDDYKYYLLKICNTSHEIDFLENFKIYSSNIDVSKDIKNPIFEINYMASNLINIQSINLYNLLPKYLNFENENTYKLAIKYLLIKCQ